MVNLLETKRVFHNDVINKKKLQRLMYLTFHNYGVIRSSLIADKIKCVPLILVLSVENSSWKE